MKPHQAISARSLLRRYWPFAISAGILVALLLFSIPYLRQQRAARWVESKGGNVALTRPDWLSENLFPRAQEWLGSKRGGGFWARPFVHTNLLNLGETDVTDDDLRRLDEFVDVKVLMLNDTAITDAGLVSLRRCPNLGLLFLHNTAITDAGLEQVEKLSTLKYLGLGGTKVTDEGVARLRKALPGCEVVSQ